MALAENNFHEQWRQGSLGNPSMRCPTLVAVGQKTCNWRHVGGQDMWHCHATSQGITQLRNTVPDSGADVAEVGGRTGTVRTKWSDRFG